MRKLRSPIAGIRGWLVDSNYAATSQYHYQKSRCVYIGALTVKSVLFNRE